MSEAGRKTITLTSVDFDPFAETILPDILPLTEPQAEVWAAVQMGDEASCAYNQCYSLRLRGPLSAESMESALQQVVNRHDALRVAIDADGEHQKIAPTSQIDLAVVDLSHLSLEAKAAEIERVLEAETTRPFELASGPLLRAALVCEAPDLHRLIVTVHHIVCDGWSSAVLFGDLARIYAADRHGLAAQLPVAASYRDYVACEAVRADDAKPRADADYWAQQYTDSIPVLELPLDAPRPNIKTYSGARQELRLDAALYDSLKKVGAKHGCTLFVTLLAGFEALLSRLSGQEDFVVGVPTAGQTLLENGHLVGHCVNLMPLRCRIEPAARFVDHLKNVRHAFLDSQSHQQVSFGSLVRKLNVPRDPSRTPLVSVTFNIDKIGAPFDFDELTLEAVESPPKRFVNFEISINVVDIGRELIVECEYNTDLFTAATIGGWLGHYEVLLEAIALDPELRIDELPLLTEAERQQLLINWNETSTAYPAGASIHELFEAQAVRTPEAVAVEYEGSRLTYAELNARANQVAHYLARHGVGPEVMVGLCVERSLEMVVGTLGILKAGGVYVPLDPDYPAPRLAFMLEDTAAPVLLTQASLRERLPAYAGRTISLDADWAEIARECADNPKVPVGARNLAYVIYTSGSTGRPKGTCIEHRSVVRLVKNTNYIELGPDEVFLQFAPISFDASTLELWGSLLNGAKLVVCPAGRLSLEELGRVIEERGVTTLWLTAVLFQQMVDTQIESLRGVRQLLAGGETLSVRHVRRMLEMIGEGRLINGYGPTENTTFTCCHVMTANTRIEHTVPIGRPISNTRVYVLDGHLRAVPVGIYGELYIGGDGLAREYLHQRELTAEKFVPDPFSSEAGARLYKTGDLVRYRADGRIEFLGRIDNQVKIRGYRIELGEIETAIARHSAIREVVVLAREDVPGDRRLVAYLVAPKNAPTNLVDQLRAQLRASLPEYMVPSALVTLDQLPLTPNGKVDHKALPVPDASAERKAAYVAPRTATEEILAGIWAEVLKLERVGRDDHFFELGGHSLFAMQAVSRVRQKLSVDLPLRELFTAPTIAGQAACIEARRAEPRPSDLTGDRERIRL
jgi:amino acid adenylation domain-containing protein